MSLPRKKRKLSGTIKADESGHDISCLCARPPFFPKRRARIRLFIMSKAGRDKRPACLWRRERDFAVSRRREPSAKRRRQAASHEPRGFFIPSISAGGRQSARLFVAQREGFCRFPQAGALGKASAASRLARTAWVLHPLNQRRRAPKRPPVCGAERGIRTPGKLPFNGFQDRRNRPLCHLCK